MAVPISLGAEITLRHEDQQCYLKSAGNNEQPQVRIETGLPLLGFEKCVFAFVREFGGVVSTNNRPLTYGSVVLLYSPVTKCAAVVLKTEQSDGSVGLKVIMRPLDERSSVFRIQPKFKSRGANDCLAHGDSIVMMVENSDLFLCVGDGASGLEIVASSEPSVWTVNRYDRGVADTQGVVMSGRVLAMQHRAHQTMLVHAEPVVPSQKKTVARRHTLWQVTPSDTAAVATTNEGSGTRNRHDAVLDAMTTDVYYVSGGPDGQEVAAMPSGALWIAENVDPSTGGPLIAGERYRFRHFVTGRYLAIRRVACAAEDYVVTTLATTDANMLEWSLWDLESSSENESGFLSSYHSYVRLRHCASAQWLAAVNDTEFGIVPSIASTKSRSRDRVLMRHAPKDVEADLFFLMAQIEILEGFTAHFRELQDFPRTAQKVVIQDDTKRCIARAQDAIVAMIGFCTLGEGHDFDKLGMPDPIRQRRFMDLKAIDRTMECILAPFQALSNITETPIAGGVFTISDIHRKELNSLYTLMRWAFKLLRQMTLSNPDAAAAVAPYVDVLLFIESCNVPLGSALSGVVSLCGGPTKSISMIGETMRKLISLIARSRSACYIDGIASCVTSETTAEAVTRLLLQNMSVLTGTHVELGRMIVYPDGQRDDRGGQHETAMPVEMFVAHGDVAAVLYYAACIRLVLTIARHAAAEDVFVFCQRCVSREEIVLVLSCGFRDAKPVVQADAIKATYAELAQVLYLATDLEASRQPRVMVVSTSGSAPLRPVSVAAASVTEGPFVRQMKHLSLDVIRANTTLVLDQPGRNALLANCLTVWHMFVKAQLASSADMCEVVPLLLEVLDGETDVFSLSTTADMAWDRYGLSEENAAVVGTKVEACKMLQTFLAQCCDAAVGEVVKSIATAVSAEIIYKLAKAQFDTSLAILDKPRLYRILLDCALYHSVDLRRSATNLLSALIRLSDTVAQDVAALHLLSPEHSESYSRMVELVSGAQLALASRAEKERVENGYRSIGQLTNILYNFVGVSSPSEMDVVESSNIAAPNNGGLEYLDLLRMWNFHETVLTLVPTDLQSHASIEKFGRCVEFFYLFCHNATNAALIAPHWSKFFDAMVEHPVELQRPVLQLLSKTWALGNVGCPAERRDIRIVLSAYAKDESVVDALRALVALLNTGVPSPDQQRHVIVLLQELDIMTGQWWMTRTPASVVYLTQLLELCCNGNNTFTRRIVQQKFPIGMVLRILSATQANRIGFKTALVRFLSSVHFCDEEEASAHMLAQAAKQSVQDETWWRLVRDDFLVRLEEVATGVEINKAMRPYVLEVALCLEAFFRHRFAAGLGNRLEWVLKELRGTLVSVSSVLANLDLIDFNADEKHVFISLARAITEAACNINDSGVVKLKQQAATAVTSANRRAQLYTAKPSREEECLLQVKKLYDQDFIDEEDASYVDALLPIVRPQNLNDKQCWRRRVLFQLLSACAIQDFDPTAIVTVLTLARRCIETAPKGRAVGLQVLFESINALRTSTVLLDAVDPQIVLASILFGCSVLDNGPKEVQNSFLNYLESNDEKFFLALKRCVDKAVLELLHWRRLVVLSSSSNFDLRSPSNCFSYIGKLFRFVQLMCEGHHIGLQEYVREQKDNLRSVNSLQVCLCCLRALLSGETHQFEDEVLQCFELLTEFCQGPCSGNQTLLISSNVCITINIVLSSSGHSSAVKQAAVTTLISLLEGCTDPLIAETVLRQAPLQTLEAVYMGPMVTEEDTELVFGAGILLRELCDLLATKPAMQYPIQQVLMKRKDVGAQTGRIQIERGENIESVYFRIPIGCLSITEESRLKLLWNVDRSSQAAKHSSFYELCDDLILEMDLMAKQQLMMADIANRYLPNVLKTRITSFQYNLGSWVQLSLVIAFAANCLFLADFEDSWMVEMLAIAQAVVSAIIMYIDFSVDGAVSFHKFKKEEQQRHGAKSQYTLDVTEVAISKRRSIMIQMNRGRAYFCAMQLVSALLSSFGFPQLLMTHLFWVITLSPAFANVIAAITQNAKTLSLTIVLGLLFSYGFTVIGFYIFPEDFDNDADSNSHENCSSLLHCFLFVVTTGLRQGGGIGDVMREKSWSSELFFARKTYDFLFFAVMIIVFLNILFGIIIDTFAELRDAKTTKEEDMRLKCFICGIDSHIFDRHGEGFIWHSEQEHNVWQYLYFIHHLRLKDPNDYTGQESFIAASLERKDFSFFPTRSLSLERSEATNAAEIAADRPAAASSFEAGGGTARSGNGAMVMAATITPELKEQFESIRTTVRRVLQRNMLSDGSSIEAQYRVTRSADGRSTRQALDVATQTHMSESVASLQYSLTAAEAANARLHDQMAAMKVEMKVQVEELWKLKVTNQSAAELHANIHTLKNETKELQRMFALVSSEKDTLMRQNLFLQDEADRLTVALSKLHVSSHLQPLLTNAPLRPTSAPNEMVREVHLDRSRLYESLQLELPASFDEERDPAVHQW